MAPAMVPLPRLWPLSAVPGDPLVRVPCLQGKGGNMSIRKHVIHMETLPLLALRGLVVFPGMLLHFDVGRKKSILALNEAMGGDQTIFLVTQKDIADDDPDQSQLYSVGVVAKIRQVLKLPGTACGCWLREFIAPVWIPSARRSPSFSAYPENARKSASPTRCAGRPWCGNVAPVSRGMPP